MSCSCRLWRSRAYGVYRHLRNWRRGAPAARFDQPARRINLVLKHAVAQGRTARNGYAGVFHRFISYGFVILTIATTVVALDADFGTSIMRGNFYLYFQSFTVDLFGALVLLGSPWPPRAAISSDRKNSFTQMKRP